MKEIYQFFSRKQVAGFLFCLSIILLAADVSDGQFFDSKLAGTPPRTRMGSYPSSTVGTNFLGLEKLGLHTYRFSLSEKNGILYTCKAGHIDTAHLRKAADWTAFIAVKTFEKLKENETEFSFKLMEPSQYHVEITYPENWKDLSEKEKEDIAFDISIRLGEYFVFTATTWHEMITWFGYKCTGIFYSEFPSAFTWEDTFSNLLGTHIAAVALRDAEHTYNEAVTLAFERELEKLDAQPSRIAKRAAKKVRGTWFSGDLIFFINMKKRHFDIGLDDGFVTPSIVPSVSGCEGAEAQPYPAPNLYFLSEYGFSVKFEIEPRVREKEKILRIVYPDGGERKERLEPVIHFAPIMAYIKEDAVKRYGHDVDLCDTTSQKLVEDTDLSMNTYDATADVSESYFGGTTSETIVAGDINGGYKFEYLAFMASQWLEAINE